MMQEIKISRIPKSDYRMNEAYKALRTNLAFCGSDVRVIAITSCVVDEGKSTVAMNLAVSLADDGNEVLFVDADLRKSVITGRYNVKGSKPGLSHLLSDQCTLEEAVSFTSVVGLDLVLSGQFPPNPVELLGSDKFGDFLDEVRELYDYVIIDTPPLGSVIDAAVIAKQCDGIAMVITPGKIDYRFAQRVKKQMDRTGVRFLGVIMNRVKLRKNKLLGKYIYKSYGQYYGEYYGEY